MPITQIPFQDPAPPPEKPLPEQLGLYDVRLHTADRDEDAHIPHLLIQLQDDLARSRKREAAWISIIVHLCLVILIVNSDWIGAYLDKHLHWRPFVILQVRNPIADKNVTFLALPPDAEKLTRKPRTNVLSDKDRIATTRRPELDLKELQKILATPPPGAPGLTGPLAPQTGPPAVAQNQPQGQPPAPRPQFESNQTAQLQAPPRPNVFSKYGGGMSAGSVIQQATQDAAAHRGGGGGQEGDFGLGTHARGRQLGALDILSDTQGVDFGPYLARILQDVRENWYRLIPESAEMKKGKLQIEFAITRDGNIAQMRCTLSSGDVALDRAAWGGITASNPFPPLPREFTGPYLALRFRFYYNPDQADLQ
ncbi:MAG TPA: TonB family protein [Terracidiphilus sp.]|nr:TonB family protein [Terracidiphilus sp.]